MPFPLNPTDGQKYVNTENGRHYVYKDCGGGEGYWGLDAARMFGHKFHDWDPTINYAEGDLVLNKHGLYEATAKQPNLNVEPALWHDYGNTITQLEWNFVGVIPLVIQSGALPDGDHYIKFEKTTTPVEGVFTLSSVNRALGDWDAGVDYHIGDVVIYHHALYKSLIASNRGNAPAKHTDSAEWKMLGYVPDPPSQPQDGQGIVWNTATDSFQFASAVGGYSFTRRVDGAQQVLISDADGLRAPKRKFTIRLAARCGGAATTYFLPRLIVQTHPAGAPAPNWVNWSLPNKVFADYAYFHNVGGSKVYFKKQGDGSFMNDASQGWGTSTTDGLGLTPEAVNFKPNGDDFFEVILNGWVRDDPGAGDWWLVSANYHGGMWGNHGGIGNFSFRLNKSIFDGIKVLGLKMDQGAAHTLWATVDFD